MEQPANLDLAALSFEQLVKFFFDHPEDDQFWYAAPRYALAEVTICDATTLDHLTQLFSNFSTVLSRYSPAQIGHGIWAMFSPSFPIVELLWDRNIPLQKRTECIYAMGSLFTEFVPTHDAEPLQKCFYLWWHIVVTGFWVHAGQFDGFDLAKLDAEGAALLETIFETLKRILQVPDPRAQGYAIHGLGHLQHPGVRELVQNYINEHKDEFTTEHILWLEQCRDGIVS